MKSKIYYPLALTTLFLLGAWNIALSYNTTATITSKLMSELTSDHHLHINCSHNHEAQIEQNNFDNFHLIEAENLITAADNTRVARDFGLFSFFTGALKSIAVWGGIKLTRYVLSKINRRARTYTDRYIQGNGGVIKARNHWQDLMNRSSCIGGREPDHMPDNRYKPQTIGYQDASDCPICSIQQRDLRA